LKIVQCSLTNEKNNGTWWSVRWVNCKKAIKGNRVLAKCYDELTEKEWVVHTVYDGLEQDDQYYFHVVK